MQKPAFTMSIVQVLPNETIPEGLLLKLHSENQSAMGFVVQDSDGLVVEKFDEMDPVEDEVKETRGILETTKKFHRMFCFGSFPEKFDAGETQPWVILKNSKGEPVLVVACEGDFPGHTSEGHSEFYTLVHEYLGPKIESMYKLLGNDPKKLAEFLKSEDFHKDLNNTFAHRAVFAFMLPEGEPFAYGKNDIGGEFSWGKASNIYGYSESAQQAATPAEEPKKRSRYSAEPDGPFRVPGTEPKPVIEVPRADPVKDPIKEAADKVAKGHWVEIPKQLHGKRKKAFIRAATATPDNPKGDLDPAWDNMTRVWVEHQTTVNSLADLDKTAAGAAVKDMKADAPEPVKATAERAIPIISGAEQTQVTAFIKKYLDGNSNRVENPLEIQKSEAKLPVLTELAGLAEGLDYFDTCTASVLKTLITERPESAWLLMLEYRSDRRKRKQLQALGDKKLSDLTGTEEVPTEPLRTAPASPEPGTVSPPEPAEVPFKKSRYA